MTPQRKIELIHSPKCTKTDRSQISEQSAWALSDFKNRLNEDGTPDSLNKEIVIMHPGPINRGVEITSDVADSQQSVILDQVENGVAIRMAVIYLLASKIKQ